mmetsp:Transcript_48922/g.141721  ORF Transcript_48922/g.141721 Transcript_48922/m.141721 type:complete len:211 (+) Transcript_48922:1849-2481(+)
MEVRHCPRHLRHEAAGNVGLQRGCTGLRDTKLDEAVQVHSAAVLHDQVEVLGPVHGRPGPRDVWVRGQVLHEAQLLLEAEELAHLPEVAPPDHLHRHREPRAVGGLEDGAHDAPPQALDEGVLAHADAASVQVEVLLERAVFAGNALQQPPGQVPHHLLPRDLQLPLQHLPGGVHLVGGLLLYLRGLHLQLAHLLSLDLHAVHRLEHVVA